MKFGFIFSLVLLSTSVFAESFRGRYYVVIFGYQGQANRAVDSHTFATFIDGSELEWGKRSDFPTISWLPATGVVRPIRRERGRNFSLEETLQIAHHNRASVRAWGPYEITPSLYQAALNQIRRLESGRVLYKMIPTLFPSNAINCIQAASQIAGSLNTGTSWGFAASQKVSDHFSRYFYSRQVQYNVGRAINLGDLVTY